MNPTAFFARASAALVALVAGYSSFSHIAHVALRYGERREVAYALPFAIDGLLIVATTAMLDDKRNGRRVRWSARLAFAFGVTASLAANVASAAPSAGARVVAAVPAIALLLAVEVLSRHGRPVDEVAVASPARVDVTPAADVTPTRAAAVASPALAAAHPSPARVVAQVAEVASSARDEVTPRPSRQSSADTIRDAAAKPGATPASVAAALGVSVRTCQRHWPRPSVATPSGLAVA
ncbi:DUF2637 domain-containing protein [Micromonospora sp. NPDC004551]|uniref:DUF2637 domain-containing protein n=1 Tax=Micromonospora sp. NPDC004551 TaxID=3154284 RepID=UPI0033BD082A